MAHAYTPGLKVTPYTRHRVRRILPIHGEVLKSIGNRVEAPDVVAETFMPGNITPVNVANMLSMPPADVPECMLLSEGDEVEEGTVLAQTKGIFGMFKSTCASRVSGTIETVSNVTGQVIIRGEPLPVQVTAYIAGEVVEVITSVMGVDVDVIADEDRIRPARSEVERLWASNEKARRLLGWTPEFGGREGFRQGIDRTVAWFSDPANRASYKSERYEV